MKAIFLALALAGVLATAASGCLREPQPPGPSPEVKEPRPSLLWDVCGNMSHIEGGACLGETLRGFSEERQCRARALVKVDGSVDVRCAAENFTFFQPRISAAGPAPRHLALYGDFHHVRIRSEDDPSFPVYFWGNASSLEVNGSAGFFAIGNIAKVRAGAAHLAGNFGDVRTEFGLEGQGSFGNITTSAESVILRARPIGHATFKFYGTQVSLWLMEPEGYGIDVYLPTGWVFHDSGVNLTQMSHDWRRPSHYHQAQPTAASDRLTIMGFSIQDRGRGQVTLYRA